MRKLHVAKTIVHCVEQSNATFGAIHNIVAYIGKGIAEVAHYVAVVCIESLESLLTLIKSIEASSRRCYIYASSVVLADVFKVVYAQSGTSRLVIVLNMVCLDGYLVYAL